jgi:aspartate aminotransferase-like enzyme
MGKLFMGCVPNISEEVLASLLKPMIDHRSEEFSALLASLTERAKQVMQTKNDVAILTSSGTGGLEAAAINLIRPGDNVIIPSCGLFSDMLGKYVLVAGGNIIKLKAEPGDQPSLEQIEDAFKKAGNVKAFFSTFDETSTGVTFTWFKEVGELCKKYNSFFIVDAHAAFGGVDLPVDDYSIDACVGVSQIGMGGPGGLCFVSVSDKAKQFIKDNPPNSVYFDLGMALDFYNQLKMTPFTPAVEIMVATDESLRMVLEEGLQTRFKRIAVCADAFYAAFDAVGIESIAKKELRSKLMLCIKYPDGIEEREFRRLLDNKYGIYVYFTVPGAPPQFRLGTVGSNPVFREGRVLAGVSAICSVVNQLGYKVDTGKAIDAAVSKLQAYPTYGKCEYPEINWPMPETE